MKNLKKLTGRKKWLIFGSSILVLLVVVATVILAPGNGKQAALTPSVIDASEQAKIIEGMGKPRHERPVIAIVALNEATEVTDLMIPYSVLSRSGVADVKVVQNTRPPYHSIPLASSVKDPNF